MIITTISHSFLFTFKSKALQNESSTQQPLGDGEAIYACLNLKARHDITQAN